MATARVPLNGTFEELDIVRLRSAIYVEDGVLPVGSIGTLVYRHDGGEAYEVEFTGPVQAVVTLRPSDLARAQ